MLDPLPSIYKSILSKPYTDNICGVWWFFEYTRITDMKNSLKFVKKKKINKIPPPFFLSGELSQITSICNSDPLFV